MLRKTLSLSMKWCFSAAKIWPTTTKPANKDKYSCTGRAYFTNSLFSAINLGISKLYNTGTGWPALQLKIQPEIGIANNKKYST